MRAIAFLGITIFFWGTAFRANAVGAEHTSALMFSALRAGPAALILLALIPLVGGRLPRGRLLLWSAVTGVLMIALTIEGISEGVARAGAGNAAVLINSSPFFVMIFGRLFLGERLSWLAVAGLLVGFAGVIVMVSSQLGGRNTGDLALGMGLALAGGVGFAVSTLLVKWLAQRDPELDVLALTAGQYLFGGGLLVVLAFAVKGSGGTAWSSGDLWGAVAWTAIGSSALATLTFVAALKLLSATRVSVWGFLAPVVAIFVEIVRGHTPDGIVLFGMALAIAGVAVVNAAPQTAPVPGRV